MQSQIYEYICNWTKVLLVFGFLYKPDQWQMSDREVSQRKGCYSYIFNTLECIFSTGSSSGDSSQMFECVCRLVVKEHGFEATLWAGPTQGPVHLEKERKVKLLSHVQFFVTPWTIAYQAPLSMEF